MKNLLLFLVILSFLLFLAFQFLLAPKLPILNGYAAKKMCSCTFLAGHDKEKVENEDLGFAPVNLARTTIDRERKTVTSSLYGLGKKRAEYRNQLGCILIQGKDDYDQSLDIKPNTTQVLSSIENVQKNVKGVRYDSLKVAAESAFDPDHKIMDKKTLGLVIYYKDSLIYEGYGEGYEEDTPMLGWSMTKSIMATFVGILQKNKVLSIDQKRLFHHWTDNRADITLHDLLQMQSGLEFEENYTDVSDATRMLFNSEDVTKIPSNKTLLHPPGSHWSYSSGTTNMISGIIRHTFDNMNSYHRFPYDSLFYRLGMYHTTMETDESGIYIGSSYCYASLKDWAKFGLLYLNEGNWYGDQIVDSTWVSYVRNPAENSNGYYGGHFWHNHGQKSFPSAPADLYHASGFEGQNVFIIPSYDAVIVRMGLNENFDFDRLLHGILTSIQPNPS